MFFEIGIARWGELLRDSTMFFEIGIARWGELLRDSTMFFEIGIARWGELLHEFCLFRRPKIVATRRRSSPQRAIFTTRLLPRRTLRDRWRPPPG